MMRDFESGRVLLVDDDLLVRTMASATLRQAGFAVTEADSGEMGLRLFDDEHFDLVLLDVMMPGMDGYAVCERLRSHINGDWLPILMLTGLNDTESIEAAYRSGATDFITKPINWALLVHRVRYGLRASMATESVMRSRESLARAQRLANLGNWEWWPAQGRIACSEELLRILGLVDEQSPCRGTPETFLRHVSPDERAAVQAAREAIGRAGTEYQLSFGIVRSDGTVRTVFEQAVAIRDAAGQVLKVEGITQDITERVEAERRIRHLAVHDTLTGLANRQFFSEMAVSALDRSRRLQSLCAVLHVDLDRFKSVNDAFGVSAGDQLLRSVAERLLTCTRSADLNAAYRPMAGPGGLARVGGNAFTVLLVDVRNIADAAAVAQRLLRAVAQPLQVGGRDLVLTASIGIALFPRDGDTVDALLRHAEQAMYAVKAVGRAGYRFFNEEMNATASAKLEVENDLRHAIVGGQLRLYFQPKINAASGAMIGAEALVRWLHPRRGLVPPGDFIPLAEESGLIVRVGDWVVEAACDYLQRWRAAGLNVVPLSINLSSPSFMQDTLVAQLGETVRRAGLETQQLTLEVTESLLMRDIEGTIARLHALREQGFGLSLDDFGTGYSSLSYLKRFPIDEVKIDRSFVRDVMNGGRDTAIVAAIIDLGREFGLTVVAEGVETAQQACFLRDHGCVIQQGYLFARPMPAEQFSALLARPQPFDLRALGVEPQSVPHSG